MAKLTVLYEFHEERTAPFMMMIRFRRGELNWDRQVLHVPLEAPFQSLPADEIEESEQGVSVLLEDLTVHPQFPRCFGIHLSSIKKRYGADGADLQHVELFWIRMDDIEEVLQLDFRTSYKQVPSKAVLD